MQHAPISWARYVRENRKMRFLGKVCISQPRSPLVR